jgi:hypothetical protein
MDYIYILLIIIMSRKNNNIINGKKKSKTTPITGRGGSYSYETSRLSHFSRQPTHRWR